MQVLKTFVRDGKRFRPGDTAPDDLDKQTRAHYQRHGMVGEAVAKTPAPAPARTRQRGAAAETKPAGPAFTGSVAPQESATAQPAEASQAAPSEPTSSGAIDADLGPTSGD